MRGRTTGREREELGTDYTGYQEVPVNGFVFSPRVVVQMFANGGKSNDEDG